MCIRQKMAGNVWWDYHVPSRRQGSPASFAARLEREKCTDYPILVLRRFHLNFLTMLKAKDGKAEALTRQA